MDIELTMTYAISTLNTYKNIHLRPLAHDILTQSLHLKDTITMARQRLTMATTDGRTEIKYKESLPQTTPCNPMLITGHKT